MPAATVGAVAVAMTMLVLTTRMSGVARVMLIAVVLVRVRHELGRLLIRRILKTL